MAKYSTGGSSEGGEGDTCELCGASSDSLREANVAGARLQVCQDCSPHDDTAHKDRKKRDKEKSRDDGSEDRKRRAVRNTASTSTVWDGDTSHWEEEGTNYDDDPLPYLVRDYGSQVEAARQEAGLQREELAEELGVDEADLLAVEQGRATQAGVGGGLVAAIEDRLDVDITE